MAVYDCFAFFNELDLLELRLQELDPVVDYFVLVEATRTFSKKEKPLYFQKNKERFSKYLDKIIYVLVDQYPSFWTHFRPITPWHYDRHQKDQCIKGLVSAKPEDHIIYSDLDEIPSAEAIERALSSKKKYQVFEQWQALYYLNYVCRRIHDFEGRAVAQQNKGGFGFWRGSVMTKKKNLSLIRKLRRVRDTEGPEVDVIPNGGWHLSYMGGIEAISCKLKSYAHTEYSGSSYSAPEIIAKCISEGTDPLKYGEKYELFSINDSQVHYLPTLKQQWSNWNHMIYRPLQGKGLVNNKS